MLWDGVHVISILFVIIAIPLPAHIFIIFRKVVKPGGSKIVPIKKSDTEKDAGKQSLMDTLPKAE